jgi:ethanolamine utilization microcompartment shell protein EutS
MLRWGSVFGMAAVVLLVPPTMQTAWGQALTGSIVGNVLDNSGAAVPGAAVTITETGKQQVRSSLTDSAGRYDFEAVQPGVYDVKISKAGFMTATKSQVTLVADQVSRVDATLEIGNITGLPGSIELQGDHATVSFRNIVLTPLTKKGK